MGRQLLGYKGRRGIVLTAAVAVAASLAAHGGQVGQQYDQVTQQLSAATVTEPVTWLQCNRLAPRARAPQGVDR